MISWLTTPGILYEGNERDHLPNNIKFTFYADSDFTYKCVSTNLPSEMQLSDVVNNYDNTYTLYLTGSLPQILSDTLYSVVVRIQDSTGMKEATYSILSHNTQVEWDPSTQSDIDLSVHSDINLGLKLQNTNGNEVFKKIEGVLPTGIYLGTNGNLFGLVTNDDIIGQTYTFKVGIFVNDKIISELNREFHITIVPADPYDLPVWITEEGYIGNVVAGQRSTLFIVASNSTALQSIFYELLPGYNLPDGITFSPTGRFDGVCNTLNTQKWEFDAVCFKYVGEEQVKVQTAPRHFYLMTNETSADDDIIWDDASDILDLGNICIGQDFSARVIAHTKSKAEVTFKLVGTNLPKGISLSKKGVFNGTVEYQPTGEYLFSIQARANNNTAIKTAKLVIKKGLGLSACQLSFALWAKEYHTYASLIERFDRNYKYDASNSNFAVGNQPLIDICTIKTFDKEVLPLLLQFGMPEWIRFGKTRKKAITRVDDYDSEVPMEKYDVFYKGFDEATYQWDELYNGDYNWGANKPDGSELIWNEAIYDTNGEQLPNDMKEPTPTNNFAITSIKNIRDRLATKIYVKRLSGDYYYFTKDQRIAEVVDPNTMTGSRDGSEWEEVKFIQNPYIFKSELNPSLNSDHDFIMPYVADVVEEQVGGSDFFTFFDYDTEVIPYWKRKEVETWNVLTDYKVGDVLLYDNKYYIVIANYTSTYTFSEGIYFLRKLSAAEVDSILSKNYIPCLCLGYYQQGKNDGNLSLINSAESKGEYWYKKTLEFDEVVASPYYGESDITTSTITIYRSVWKNYPENGIIEKE